MYYSAIEMQKILDEKYPNTITVRQIRTYSQQEMISPPVRVDGKLKYEDKHLKELETIINLKEKGKKKEEIRSVLDNYDPMFTASALQKESMFYDTENIFKYKTEELADGLRLQFNETKFSEELIDEIKSKINSLIMEKGEF